MTYEEAVKAASERNFTGIGFVIPENVVFLNKDHIDPNDPYVAKLLKMFPTYAETLSIKWYQEHCVI